VGVVATGLLLIGTSVSQGSWQLYHLAPLPVGATAFVVGVGARWWTRYGQPPWPLVVGLTVACMLATAFLTLETSERTRLVGEARVIGLIVASLACAWALVMARSTHEPRPASRGTLAASLALALVVLVAFLPAQAPDAAWYVKADRTNASWNALSDKLHEGLGDLADRTGRDGPVLYVAYGVVPYHMGIPTRCRYPSPLWIQRGTVYRALRGLWSYRDNLACFDRRLANDVVIQRGWAQPGRLTADLRRGLAEFDCTHPITRLGIGSSCPSRDAGDER